MDESLKSLREWLVNEHSLTISHDRLKAITPYVEQVVTAGVDGAFVELGCHRGAMTVWVRSILDLHDEPHREMHVYDSFQGLPAPGASDSDHVGEGELVTTPDEVRAVHARWGKTCPVIHAGWFEETLPTELPKRIAFGYLDGDFYDSIMTSLQYCVPRMAPGGILIIDDYADMHANPAAWNGLPGVKAACDAYFSGSSPVSAVVLEDSDLPFGVYQHPVGPST
ncbi:TylF/MycF/NovP-related O-methyltransferase [Streptomyces xylophagus]|uniref:TylF/MycF/NovP-related O-methyltransferase n=1 Tax=Streptomyces xylophagus TaxID=285514 RepID=UPI0005BB2981|nr:TylF/MycF/NovP-related O-methyltransferase [Streptomyces xylophagus]